MARAATPSGAFVARVYAVIGAIPKGNVATYGLVAALAGFPGRARAVGWALRTMSKTDAAWVPWHRVVAAGGRVALRAGQGASRQRRRLLAEGVAFRRSGFVDMAGHDFARPGAPRRRR